MMEEPQPEQNGQEYDLKASTKRIGQLYPVLKAADGEVIDGVHRIESDPSWKALVLENIKTPEDKIITRLVANFHRRTVATEEKAAWINQLAEIYKNNGLKVEGAREKAQGRNEIVRKICEVTGISHRTVMDYLEPCFKQQGHRRLDPEQHTQVRKPPEEIIFNHLKISDPSWAKGVIERFKEEHEKELLESPIFRKKILEKIGPSLLKHATVPSLTTLYHSREELADRKQKAQENAQKIGYEQLPDLYETFIQECPECICSKCPHADTCIERVRPGD